MSRPNSGAIIQSNAMSALRSQVGTNHQKNRRHRIHAGSP